MFKKHIVENIFRHMRVIGALTAKLFMSVKYINQHGKEVIDGIMGRMDAEYSTNINHVMIQNGKYCVDEFFSKLMTRYTRTEN